MHHFPQLLATLLIAMSLAACEITLMETPVPNIELAPTANASATAATILTALAQQPPTATYSPTPTPTDTPIPTDALTATDTPNATPQIRQIDRFAVDAMVQKNRTGITVNAGDVLELEYLDGQWTGEIGKATYTTGCGTMFSDTVQEHVWPLPPDKGMGAGLIGYIGREPFWIGCEPVTITAIANGELYLGMNDCDVCYWDNDGEIYVKILVQAPTRQ